MRWKMRIIDNWQYRYIEKCLYTYPEIKDSKLDTEMRMIKAIESALEFFKDTPHVLMMEKFYFEADEHRKRLTNAGHYRWVCKEILHTEESNGYVIRREIIYRIAMHCYALGLFQIKRKNT